MKILVQGLQRDGNEVDWDRVLFILGVFEGWEDQGMQGPVALSDELNASRP